MHGGQRWQGTVLWAVLAWGQAACAHPQQPERVALTFAWPQTLYAQVEQQVEKADTGKAPVRFTLRYHVDSRRSEAAQRVAFSRVTFEPPLPPDLEAATRPGLELTHVLDLRGEVTRVEGVERAFEAAAQLPAFAKAPPEQRALMRRLGEEAALNQAQGLWDTLVGRWAGRTLELGQEQRRSEQTTLDFLPGGSARSDERLAVRRRVPCREGGALECVELWSRSEVDPAAMGEALRTLFQRLEAQGAAPLRLPEGLQVGRVTEELLVAEPGTLVPHALTVRTTLRMPDLDAAEPRVVERSEVKVYRFSYGPLPVKRSIDTHSGN